MKLKFSKKELSKLGSIILNSKITYFFIIAIILIQFILISIIFLQNKKSKYLVEQTNFKVSTLENKQNEINTKVNSIQANLMRMSAQIYRLSEQQE